MASGLPKQPYVYRKGFLPEIQEKRENPSAKDFKDEEKEPPKIERSNESDIEIRINKKRAIAFIMFCIILYSFFSFGSFPTLDGKIKMTSEKTNLEVAAGSDFDIPFFLQNDSLFEKSVGLRLESPYFSQICKKSDCFQGGNVILHRRSKEEFILKVRVPRDAKSGEMAIHTQDASLLFTVSVTSQENLFCATKEILDRDDGKRIMVNFKNLGGKTSKIRLNLENVSQDWSANLSENDFTLDGDEEKDIFIDISSKDNASAFSAVLYAKTESGFSQNLLLATDAKKIYDFSIAGEPRYMINKEGANAEFTIRNTGNAPDTYSISLTSYPSEWSVNLPQKEIMIQTGEAQRISLFVLPTSERNASILVNVTSLSNKASKNLTLHLLPQKVGKNAVLAEHFTATWCFVCPIAERAIERVASENPDLILLNYHLKDSITTSGSDRRAQGLYDMGLNVSTVIFNGTKMVPFLSGGEDALYGRYLKFYNDLISVPKTFDVFLSGFAEGNNAMINAKIRPLSEKNYDVYFILFRDPFNYKNGSRRYVVRDVLGPEKVTNGGGTDFSKSFTIPPDDLGNEGLKGLGVVVIIQDPLTKMVWQSVVYMFG